MSSSYAEAGPLERALVLGFAVLVFGSIGFMYWWFGRDEAAPPPDGGPVVVATASPSPSASASVSAAAEPAAPVTEPAATATAPPADPTVDPTAEPALTPTPEPDGELAELRASSRFLELAEHDRAQGAQWSQFGYDIFAPTTADGVAFEWENKAELWDSVAPRFRDECLLAGEPTDRPLWGSRTNVVAGISSYWNTETTDGRGHFVLFQCAVRTPDGDLVEQVGGALVATDAQQAGEVVGIFDPVRVPEDATTHLMPPTKRSTSGRGRGCSTSHSGGRPCREGRRSHPRESAPGGLRLASIGASRTASERRR